MQSLSVRILRKGMKIRYYLLLLAYYLMVVLPHEVIGKWISSLFLTDPRAYFDGVILGLLSIVFIGIASWLTINAQSSDRKLLLTYSLLTVVLIGLCINMLFVINVEGIHFIQYALFAIICFQLNSSYFRTMFWTVLAGAMDELYQYVWLAPERTDYYDFNDVVINTVGAGIGLIVIRTFRRPAVSFSFGDFLGSKEMYVLIGIVACLCIGLISGILSYGSDPDALFSFIKEDTIGFWKRDRLVNWFHVIKPIEGLIITSVLILFYSGLERGYESIPPER